MATRIKSKNTQSTKTTTPPSGNRKNPRVTGAFLYTYTDRAATVFIKGRPFTVPRTAMNFDAVLKAADSPKTTVQEMLELVSPKTYLKSEMGKVLPGDATIEVTKDGVIYNGEKLHSAVAKKLMDILNQGLDLTPWILFLAKVYENPWLGARDELYDWMEAANLPICADGDFIAYKKVGADYLDLHSRTISNHVGQIVSVDRAKVDNNSRVMCSTGLHFGSMGYFGLNGQSFHSGVPVMIIKINPADVIAIPSKSEQKGRTCRYEVIDEWTIEELVEKNETWPAVVEATVLTEDDLDPAASLEDAGASLSRPAAKKTQERKRTAARKAVMRTGSPVSQTDEVKVINGPVPDAKKATKKSSKPTTKGEQGRIVTIETAAAGRLSKTGFKRAVKEHGSIAAWAAHLGVSQGTIQAWKKKLGL